MAIGLEQFRNVGSTGVNRIALNQGEGEGTQVVKSKLSFMGRIVSWFRNDRAGSETKAAENRDVRTAFKQALTKAFGERIANQISAQNAEGGQVFENATRKLSGRRVTQMTHAAQKLMVQNFAATKTELNRFMAQRGEDSSEFVTAAFEYKDQHPEVPNELLLSPEFKKAFRKEVMKDPDVRGGKFLGENRSANLKAAFGNAVTEFLARKETQFSRMFPELHTLVTGENPISEAPYPDSATVLQDLAGRLGEEGALHGEPEAFATKALTALERISQVPELLGRTEFGMEQVDTHHLELLNAFGMLNFAKFDLAGIEGPLSEDAEKLRQTLMNSIDMQLSKMESKIQHYQLYSANDPLSQKSAAYNKLVWAQAGGVIIGGAIDRLTNGDNPIPIDEGVLTALLEARGTMIGNALEEYNTASTENRVDRENPPFRQQKADIIENTVQVLRQAAEAAGPGEARDVLIRIADNVAKDLKKARVIALNTQQLWTPVQNNMTVSRDGVTKTYRSDIIPVSHTNSSVGHTMRENGLTGISAGTYDDRINARNLQVSRLVDTETGTVKHQSIRHGVLDPWKAGSSQERKDAAVNHADQVLHLALEETAPELKARLLQEVEDPSEDPPTFKHTHVNFNLTTPVDRIVAAYNEGTFTKNQFEAFGSHNGEKVYTVRHDGEDVELPPVELDTITFSFGVNDLATEPGFWTKPLYNKAWNNVYEHDKANLEKLVGDLQPKSTVGGAVGDVVERLQERSENMELTAEQRKEAKDLMIKIQTEVDIARDIFVSDGFRKGEGDPYKMVRHAMRVVDLMSEGLQTLGDTTQAVTQSQGCKSNKDRGGMADVEIKTQTIIEDMGGKVEPNGDFEEQDRNIYNVVLTTSGQLENQRWNTALPGSKNAKEAGDRIGNEFAQEYAMGFESYVKA